MVDEATTMAKEFTPRYERCFDYVMRLEGVLSDHPRDPGGLTAFGITWRDFPTMFSGGPPTRDEAKAFYVQEGFWRPVFDSLSYEPTARELFESSVLCGRRRAVMFAQTAINYLVDWRDLSSGPLKVDGILGALTFTAVEWMAKQNYGHALYRAQNQEQGERLKQVGTKRFIRGWFAHRLD